MKTFSKVEWVTCNHCKYNMQKVELKDGQLTRCYNCDTDFTYKEDIIDGYEEKDTSDII